MVPRKVRGFRAEALDGQVLLFHPAQNSLVQSNETATLIWELCDGQRSVEQIVEMLSAAYPDSAADIREEVPGILNTLATRGAIEWA